MKKFTFEQEYLYLEIEYVSGAPPKKKIEDSEEENRGGLSLSTALMVMRK